MIFPFKVSRISHLNVLDFQASFTAGLKWLEDSPLSAIFAKSSMEFLYKFSSEADRTLSTLMNRTSMGQL